MKVTKDLIYGLSGSLLSQRYDNPQPTPKFHLDVWDYCCDPHPRVAIAAPRGHAKSTAVTGAYVMAEVLFREADFVVIISATERQAVRFLTNIKREIYENKQLRDLFQINLQFDKDNDKEIIFEMGPDKHKACIIAMGAGGGTGPIRGALWNNKRPNLIIFDDVESDEEVASEERRQKVLGWLYEAVLPAMSDYGKIRIVGTILHFDSMLERLMPPTTGEGAEFTKENGLMTYSVAPEMDWKSVKFRAHTDFDDFSEILWPEKFTEARLRAIRAGYVKQGFSEGYSQEYLNYPISMESAFFRKTDLIPMQEDDYKSPKVYYGAVDLAISTEDKRAYTAITIGGMDERGLLHIVEVIRKRLDTLEIVDELLNLQVKYDRMGGLQLFAIEKGAIEKAIGPHLKAEMLRRNIFMNLWIKAPHKDKKFRAGSIQARMRQGGVRIDKEAHWFPTFEDELLKFDAGQYKDQVDAMAWLGLMINSMVESPSQVELDEQAWRDEMYGDDTYNTDYTLDRNRTTGY